MMRWNRRRMPNVTSGGWRTTANRCWISYYVNSSRRIRWPIHCVSAQWLLIRLEAWWWWASSSSSSTERIRAVIISPLSALPANSRRWHPFRNSTSRPLSISLPCWLNLCRSDRRQWRRRSPEWNPPSGARVSIRTEPNPFRSVRSRRTPRLLQRILMMSSRLPPALWGRPSVIAVGHRSFFRFRTLIKIPHILWWLLRQQFSINFLFKLFRPQPKNYFLSYKDIFPVDSLLRFENYRETFVCFFQFSLVLSEETCELIRHLWEFQRFFIAFQTKICLDLIWIKTPFYFFFVYRLIPNLFFQQWSTSISYSSFLLVWITFLLYFSFGYCIFVFF